MNVALPADLFKLNTIVSSSGFTGTFGTCSLLPTYGANLFRYNTAVSSMGFYQTFQSCNKLQLRADTFYVAGEEGTRFNNRVSDFTQFCLVAGWSGAARGTAPELWLCTYGSATPVTANCFNGHTTSSLDNFANIAQKLTINVSPATDWTPGDLLTGQSSARTCNTCQKRSATVYWVNQISAGSWTSGEILGVTGNANKLADQNVGAPTFVLEWA